MKTKLLVMATTLTMLLTAATATAEKYKHDWIDDIQNSDQTTNVYTCECGEVKHEDVASIRDYVITIDANGGIVETPKLITKDGKIKLPIAYMDSDYQFVGWYTENAEEVTSDWVYEEDTTIYAHWSIVGSYTLYFAPDGGSYVKPLTENFGTTISLARYTPTKIGYIFEGWYSDPQTKENRIYEFTYNENDVVYARWRDDGSAIIASQQVTEKALKNDEILQYGQYVDEKTGVPVTALWVEQQQSLKRLMEINNSIYN